NDRPRSRADAQSSAGAIQPPTTVAVALPATPSRAEDPLMVIQVITHHGNEASAPVAAADALRMSSLIGSTSLSRKQEPSRSALACASGWCGTLTRCASEGGRLRTIHLLGTSHATRNPTQR